IMELLKAEGAEDILVVGGGIIPEDDIPNLKKAGISAIFGPGTPLDEIVEFIKSNVIL
ncbi:MAG: cobalamin B12-binding domain-containing protein, partial [Candidatus Thorarchaeota archaeon]